MPKESLYFSHDYGARNDPKLINLQIKHGMAGIGCYWCIVEMIFEQGGEIPFDCDRIAFALRTDANALQSIINDFDLFVINNNILTSNSILRRLNLRSEKSIKAKESAEFRWRKPQNNADALNNHANAFNIDANVPKNDAIKEIKEIKDIKDINICSETFENESSTTKRIDSNPVDEFDKKKNPELVEKRKSAFKCKLDDLLNTTHNRYAFFDDEISRFFSYWTELNKSETKMRFELQQTFQVGLRLDFWMNNAKKRALHTSNQEDKASRTLRVGQEQTELAMQRIQNEQNFASNFEE